MADQSSGGILQNPLKRLAQVLRLEKKEIGAIYFYAILAGLLQLSVPLGIQAIINFVLAGGNRGVPHWFAANQPNENY
jgi:ATP-binding cassette, subfamily B, bacterial